ncbi:glycosyltransferase family 2 protein [Geobacter sulfurreducens]|uniref:glycosyltransferase family 2 protein n=1 Tax=Geobacter sulfurreducens TaxID=35554 RepID=UPI0001E342BA|nr:glycosyltransferase [Geobacter sulfurreducens]ADN78359.1 glycosyltransferase [Geobacter sulfurreducens KN400]
MPTVSVIIPTYNGGKYICQTINSILSQEYLDYEILVVDDGSEEDMLAILSSFGDKIKYVHKKRSGPADTRNYGIRLSVGEYIAFLDHDDIWWPNKLKVQVDIMDSNPNCSLVYSYPELIDADGNKIINEPPSYFPSGNVFYDFIKYNRITTFSATLIRRSIFEQTGLLDDSPEVLTCDDYDLWLRIADISEVIYSPGRLVQYRIHPGNLVKNYDQNLKAHIYVLNKALNNSLSINTISISEVAKYKSCNMHKAYKYFASIYYWNGDIIKAKELYAKAIKIKYNDIISVYYFILCHLPNKFLSFVRAIKQKISQIKS